jgi:putative transposase
MRNEKTAPGEWYHLFNRGTDRKKIFLNDRDYIRFLFLILHLQHEESYYNVERYINSYIKNNTFDINLTKSRFIDLSCYCLMPNHFHLLVYERSENGIPKYMQRILNAYTKYFNTKYRKNGHVFEGPYKLVRVKDNNQLLYLSGYIHNNPRDLRDWQNKEEEYPWSSYSDYVSVNRWGDKLLQEILLKQFGNKSDYHKFLKENTAKQKLLNKETLIDSV